MMNKLVAYSVQAALAEGEKHYWLSELFEKGFTGYSNFSTRQLHLEMQLRGLVPTEDELDAGIDDADDELEDLESISDFVFDKVGAE